MKFTIAIIAAFAGLALAAPQNQDKIDLQNCDDAADAVLEACNSAGGANCFEESTKEKLNCQAKQVQSDGDALVAEKQAAERAKNKEKAVAAKKEKDAADAKLQAEEAAKAKNAERFKKQQEAAKQKAAKQKAAQQNAAQQNAAQQNAA
ncbi:hypothetical protein CRV24_005175 [Beauveria bassiana]|nr:hypothetical protein CRV24_005175 [Beauveria bassiana]KAH8709894.1 hypothetical protein HC256_009801 [Beauveria bassiana]